MSPPAVTVVIATYNWSNVLPYSIASVLDQTFTDFELLVIGDGCTDDSAHVVTAVDDPRVQWHNLDVHTGHQAGPNDEGIRLARGSVIAYLGHDDLWLPHHLETLVAVCRAGAPVALGKTLFVAPDGPAEVIPSRWWRYWPGDWIPPTAVVHLRALAAQVGSWRPPADTGVYAPEIDLWRRMAEVGGRPKLVPRLTNVKLPAQMRRGVYRERPNDEQSEWLARIQAADDPERSLAALAPRETPTALARALRGRVRLRTRLRPSRALPKTPAADRIQAAHRFMGLEE